MTNKVLIQENGYRVNVVATPIEVRVKVSFKNGDDSYFYLSPAKAKALAKALIKMADKVNES